MGAIADLMTEIATTVGTVTGIRFATSDPNETQAIDTFAVVFLLEGVKPLGPQGTRRSLSRIAVDVLKVRRNLPKDLAVLHPFLDSIPDALTAEVAEGGDQFKGKMETFEKVTTTFLPFVEYAGIQMIGYRFIMENCKILVTV